MYFPNLEVDDAIGDVYSDLEELCILTNREDNLIIMSDWNAVVEEKELEIKDNTACKRLERNSSEPIKP